MSGAISVNQLKAAFQKEPASRWLICGDEPLLIDEARAAIRQFAKVDAIERIELDDGALDSLAQAQSGSLFGARRLVEIVAAESPKVRAAAALVRFAESFPDGDDILSIAIPIDNKKTMQTAWFRKVSLKAKVVHAARISARELPSWIRARLAKQKQTISDDALHFLSAHTEGNLLAAHQEIQKLEILYGEGDLDDEKVRRAVLDSARFDVFDLGDALISGSAARFCRVLNSLLEEGVAEPFILWILVEEIRTLLFLTQGKSPERRMWEGQKIARTTLARKISERVLYQFLRRASQIDRIIKGLAIGNAKRELTRLGAKFIQSREGGKN